MSAGSCHNCAQIKSQLTMHKGGLTRLARVASRRDTPEDWSNVVEQKALVASYEAQLSDHLADCEVSA